jgi:adenylate cyclase
MALSDLAIACHFEAVFGWAVDIASSYSRSGEAARQAVAIDDSDANAQAVLALHNIFAGRHEEARRRLRRALDLDPNSPFVHGYLGASHAFVGDYETALHHYEAAMRLSPRDPLLVTWHVCKGWAALLSERYPEAVEFATEAQEANPEFPDVYAVLASAQGHLGNSEAGREALYELMQRMPGLTTTDSRLNRPFGTAAQREGFLEGLGKAGLPAG